MTVNIHNGKWLHKDFYVTTSSAFRETETLGYPQDYWTLDGSSVHLAVKPAPGYPGAPLVTADTVAGTIMIKDTKRRIIQFNVPHTDFAAVPAGTYYYDVVVIGGDGFHYTRLRGKFAVLQGIAAP